MSKKSDEYFARRTAESIGKKVRNLDGSMTGVIVSGDFKAGRWDVQHEDGRVTTHNGPDLFTVGDDGCPGCRYCSSRRCIR
ncbi:hypothetical protein [Thermomonospora umbrina]|uniref:Uncharacterized protein n=1 Tax=Thermomonospora umbrina TaxID=111806 RepID=A0A3D9SXP0_9ACTN|nr:hypothetical protein [Thermomonospora umbrina]REF00328.1 hypothetical protein DFJ69_5860 [Thermomonospora umbrina]